VFTQNFFTDNATHKQNCTSFNPKRVITYNVNNGKPFLDMSGSAAQIPKLNAYCLHIYAAFHFRALKLNAYRSVAGRASLQLFYHSSTGFERPAIATLKTTNF
jgi:hypothetical protein